MAETPSLTWRDMPAVLFGIIGIVLGLVAVAQLSCVALTCRKPIPTILTFLIIGVVSASQQVYLRFWRAQRARTLQVVLAGYILTILALIFVLRQLWAR